MKVFLTKRLLSLICMALLLIAGGAKFYAADESEVLKRLQERRERGEEASQGTVGSNSTAVATNQIAAPITLSSEKPGAKSAAAQKKIDAKLKAMGKSPKAVTSTPGAIAAKPGELAWFSIVSERNIFDPDRRPRVEKAEEPKRVVVDWYALVGLMKYEKGELAMFDGSSERYKKVVKPGGKIGEYTLESVTQEGTNNFVKLKSTNAEIDFRMGMQLRREDGGEWKLTARTEAPTQPSSILSPAGSDRSSRTSPGSSRLSSSGLSREEILERVRKKRESESRKEPK